MSTVLRVGINLGNALLAEQDAETGSLRGIAAELARELARRLAVDALLIPYPSAGVMADAAKAGEWDVAFLAADAARAQDISFTTPYLEIDATYLVPAGSPINTLADVDRSGVRIAVSDKGAYDLALRRSITNAELVRAPSVDKSVELFFAENLEVLAGLRPLLVGLAEAHPGCRVLDGRFAAILQAAGTPRGRDLAAIEAFIRDAIGSGLVQHLVDANHIRGVSIAT